MPKVQRVNSVPDRVPERVNLDTQPETPRSPIQGARWAPTPSPEREFCRTVFLIESLFRSPVPADSTAPTGRVPNFAMVTCASTGTTAWV